MTKNGNKWQKMTMSNSEWQRVVQWMKNEWEEVKQCDFKFQNETITQIFMQYVTGIYSTI